MTTATLPQNGHETATRPSVDREAQKQVLLDEVLLGLNLAEKGVRFDREAIARFQDQTSLTHVAVKRTGLTGFDLPHGISARSHFSKYTPYSLEVEAGSVVLYDEGRSVGAIDFVVPNPVAETVLSSGVKLRDVGGLNPEGGMHVMYSAECSLKDKGLDCFFCGFNERAKDGNANKVPIKSARQVAEAYTLARRAGQANHFRITGGFIPERREVEYYIDVAEAIHEDWDSFYGVAVIGAPADLSVLPKYKEAGFQNVSHNLEIWHKDIFAALCPGKERETGGWQHWVDALHRSVEIFGRGNVHTNFVGGLEPLDSVLEGIEYLANIGVVAHFSVFRPEIGTQLEGWRSPEARWHYNLVDKATNIFRRHGFTNLQMYSGPASGPHAGEVFRIKGGEFDENGILSQWRYPDIDGKGDA
jgi:hypothetical protein